MSSSKSLVARVVVAVLRFYRTAISPLRPPACRFSPSCSAYAVEAIERFGAARGSWLALRRLLRCHPFHAGGHDPVPPAVGSADADQASPRSAISTTTATPVA
ncbi:MAG TPA: membrane protein insertion efficiency factor YidD [Jatrophihabitans sp.]|nr:membrane protein insertion efficiency factor YidD [Jatrophihabitans sp.]